MFALFIQFISTTAQYYYIDSTLYNKIENKNYFTLIEAETNIFTMNLILGHIKILVIGISI